MRSHVIGFVSLSNDWDFQGYLAVEVFLENLLCLLEAQHLSVMHSLQEARSEVLLWYLRIWSDGFGRRLAVAC